MRVYCAASSAELERARAVMTALRLAGHDVYDWTIEHRPTAEITRSQRREAEAACMCELVRLFTDPGDLILDPFAGSGTTGLAARLEGRRAILIEREERYCDVAARRLERMPRGTEAQPSLFTGAM